MGLKLEGRLEAWSHYLAFGVASVNLELVPSEMFAVKAQTVLDSPGSGNFDLLKANGLLACETLLQGLQSFCLDL